MTGTELTVAVVGHGASPQGLGLGAELDAHDVIVRLHNVAWQAEADYGTRCTWCVLPGPWLFRALEALTAKPRAGYWIYDPRGEWAGKPLPAGPASVIYTDAVAWTDRLQTYGAECGQGRPALTRGAFALLIAMSEMRKRFPRRPLTVTLVGFDGLIAGRFTPHAKGAEPPVPEPIGEKSNRRHDMAAERALVFTVARELDVRLRVHGEPDWRAAA